MKSIYETLAALGTGAILLSGCAGSSKPKAESPSVEIPASPKESGAAQSSTGADAAGDEAPLLLAEVDDPARFSPLLDQEIARLNALPVPHPPGEAGSQPRLRRITDPASESATEGKNKKEKRKTFKPNEIKTKIK